MKGTKTKNNFLSLLVSTSYKYRKKKTNEVRKKYMDMKLNAAYLFSFIKQRTTVIKKKQPLP